MLCHKLCPGWWCFFPPGWRLTFLHSSLSQCQWGLSSQEIIEERSQQEWRKWSDQVMFASKGDGYMQIGSNCEVIAWSFVDLYILYQLVSSCIQLCFEVYQIVSVIVTTLVPVKTAFGKDWIQYAKLQWIIVNRWNWFSQKRSKEGAVQLYSLVGCVWWALER